MEQITSAAEWALDQAGSIHPGVVPLVLAALTVVWLLSRNPKGTLLTTVALFAFFVWQDPNTARDTVDVHVEMPEHHPGFRVAESSK